MQTECLATEYEKTFYLLEQHDGATSLVGTICLVTLNLPKIICCVVEAFF